jgi:hypothetical protein
MTNDEGNPNDEGPNDAEPVAQPFVIRLPRRSQAGALSLFRHSSLVLRHFSAIIPKSSAS